MSGMLFPPPPEDFRYFKPKSSNGVLAKFCAECGSHLDAHAYQWLTGGYGSVRACPPQDQIAPPSSSTAATSGRTSGNQTPNASHILDRSSLVHAHGSHHLAQQMKDVDLSLTSSGLVGDKKTVGNVPAHHRFYGARGAQQQVKDRQESNADVFSKKNSSQIYPRSVENIPQQQPPEECQCDDNNNMLLDESGQQHQHAVAISGYHHNNSQQPGGRNFQLYDESFSTPVPFGTDVDLRNPPAVAGPKGKRHIDRSFETEEVVPPKHMSALRQKMERGNMAGAGGVCVDQDAVRPDCAIPRSKVTKQRKDAQSNILGAGGSWG